jgi:hypothetical protein
MSMNVNMERCRIIYLEKSQAPYTVEDTGTVHQLEQMHQPQFLAEEYTLKIPFISAYRVLISQNFRKLTLILFSYKQDFQNKQDFQRFLT